MMRLNVGSNLHRVLFILLFLAIASMAAGCALTDLASAPDTSANQAPPATIPAGATPSTGAQPTAPASAVTAAAAQPTAPAPATSAPSNDSSVSGDAVRIELVAGQNEARYRVREQLARLNFPSDAVGATRNVTGTIVAHPDGTIVADHSLVRVDLRTLKSDESQRDRFIGGAVLQTQRYPYADFQPTEAHGLTLPVPKSGPLKFQLVGNLTIHGVTRPTTWDVSGNVNGDEATGQATTSFKFEDFQMSPPTVSVVLSVEDNIRLEIDLDMRRVSG